MLNVPYGVEAEFNLYLVHHRNFKFYVITGAELYWLDERPSVNWLRGERGSMDLVVGGGIEVQWKITMPYFKSMSLSLEWRMFAPNPIWVVESFADFGRLIYRETAKEGQIWIGATFWL